MGRRAIVTLEIDLEEIDDHDIDSMKEMADFLDEDGIDEIRFHAFETPEPVQQKVTE